MNDENPYVSTAQVSQALGVSVTTVKRWVDDGVLPAHRTAGGHRKVLTADVKRLVRDGRLPHVDMSRLVPKAAAGGHDPRVLCDQLMNAVANSDADAIRSIIHGGYQSGLPIEVLADKVISPAMVHVGHDWAAGKLDVMQEHRVTQACIAALYELTGSMRVHGEKDRPVAVGGAPEHDHYVLPSLLAKLTLLDLGWNAINLGPHTPLSAFRTAINELAPRLLWVSVSHVASDERFLDDYALLYQEAERRGVAVAIGGRAITDSLRLKMPYTTYGDGLAQLAAFARTLHRRPQRPRRGRPPGSDQNS